MAVELRTFLAPAPIPDDDRDELRRLWVAVALSPSLAVCEGLLAGVPVSVMALDTRWHWPLRLQPMERVVLDDALAYTVNALGPLKEIPQPRRRT